MTDYPIHPAAAAFALMSGDALDALVADLRERGQLFPIVVDADGVLLDGRNRLAACRRLKIAPIVVGYTGDDPAGFILSVNVHRRHLTQGQRAMAIAKLTPDAQPGGRRTRASRESLHDVDRGTVSHARIVVRWTPDAVDAVVAGTLGLDAAYKAARAIAFNRYRDPAPPAAPAMKDRSAAAVAQRIARLRELAADGYSIPQAAPVLGYSEETLRAIVKRHRIDMPGERAVNGTHRHNADRILDQTVMDAENVVADVGLIRLAELSRAQLPDWIARLRRARTGLSHLIRTLEGVAERVSPHAESRRHPDNPAPGRESAGRTADPLEDLPGGAGPDAAGARARDTAGI